MRRHLPSRLAVSLLAVAVFAIGCEDPVPDDYVPELVIQGFVLAGSPIDHILIYQSQPVTDTFHLERAMIRNAQVTLLENGVPIAIEFADDSLGGSYRAVDTSHLALYNATYELTVEAIGKKATATARTLDAFDWIRKPTDSLHYPGAGNELQPVDSLRISWEGQTSVLRYGIGIECLDTLGYGEYLEPPTEELNNRVREEDFYDGTLIANERTRYGFSTVSNTPVVWGGFAWFGKQRLWIYAGDKAFQDWLAAVGFGQRSQYDYRLSNVKGGLGTFAGASRISSDLFLFKEKK